jgi:hypothetical protein
LQLHQYHLHHHNIIHKFFFQKEKSIANAILPHFILGFEVAIFSLDLKGLLFSFCFILLIIENKSFTPLFSIGSLFFFNSFSIFS